MIPNDIIELISGTDNKYSKAYQEAANEVNSNNERSINHIKGILKSIESKSIKEAKISSSRGSIKKFKNYEDIVTAFKIIGESKNSKLYSIYKSLIDYSEIYALSYSAKCRLIMLEYEMAVYMLITGLTIELSKYILKDNYTNKLIDRQISSIAKILNEKNHKEYLNGLLNAKKNKPVSESIALTEGFVGDSVDILKAVFGIGSSAFKFGKTLVTSIKSSLFGILPLMRSCMYFWYKRKADTILALENHIHYIQLNIEHLKNIQTMDKKKKDEIIKKQEAVIMAMKKKSLKLRAELTETSKEAEVELKTDKPTNDTKTTDDDFILESEGIDLNVYKDDI